MSKQRFCFMIAVLFTMLPAVWADFMVVDRGLPAANLNNIAGADRSNVDWASTGAGYFLGDDFVATGSYTIDKIRVWFDECNSADGCNFSATGTNHSAVSLYASVAGQPLNLLESGNFTGGGVGVSNTNISVTAVNYPGATGETQYQAGNSGGYWQLWQLDFSNLNLVVQAGQTIQFGVLGAGNSSFYLEASNKLKGGVPADSADGIYREFDGTNPNNVTFADFVDSSTNGGWDKGSDINVQVFATPEPASWSLLGTMILGLAALVTLAGRRARLTV